MSGSKRPATRTSARRTCTSSPTASPRRTRTSGRSRTRSRRAGSPAARAAARQPRSQPGSPTPRSAPTPAARSASPPPAAESSASSRRYGLVPLDGCFPLAPTFDHAGPMARTVADCAGCCEALAPEFDRARAARQTSQSVSPGPTAADRSSPTGSARRPRFSTPSRSTSRSRPASARAFMREVADVHRDLFAESADSYGENVRAKIERCLALTDAEVDDAADRRDAYRERAAPPRWTARPPAHPHPRRSSPRRFRTTSSRSARR